MQSGVFTKSFHYCQNIFPYLVLEGVVGFGGDLDEDVVVEGPDGSWDADDVLEVLVPAVVEVVRGVGNVLPDPWTARLVMTISIWTFYMNIVM